MLEETRNDCMKHESIRKVQTAEIEEKDEVIRQLQQRIIGRDNENRDQFVKLKEKLMIEMGEKEKLEQDLEELRVRMSNKLEEYISKNEQAQHEMQLLRS